MKRFLLWLVRVYQRLLSPLKRQPSCRYLPTCSQYAREAIEKYGAWRGFWKALRRVLRCHPFASHGYDPP